VEAADEGRKHPIQSCEDRARERERESKEEGQSIQPGRGISSIKKINFNLAVSMAELACQNRYAMEVITQTCPREKEGLEGWREVMREVGTWGGGGRLRLERGV